MINRDSAMERGELEADEKLADSQRGSTVDGSPSSTKAEPIEDNSLSDTARGDEEKMKEENLPDGDENESEWREGPHKIIERRAGPGEEVSCLNLYQISLLIFLLSG